MAPVMMTSNTTSVNSIPEGYRNFKGNARYMLPTDQDEIDRLDFQHYIIRQLQHGNYNAPIEDSLTNGIKVLDAGCGTGRWTIDMAEDYPASEFVGLDVADMFPKTGCPENCTFINADTLKKLPFEDNTFDFVFQRLMLLAFTPADWDIVISELVRVTKPGGWIELYEVEMQMQRPGGTFLKFYKGLETAASLNKIDMSLVNHLPDLVSSYLENVHSDYLSLPFGWHGPVGQLFLSNWELCYRALQHILAPIMGVSDTEYSDLIAQVCVEFPEKKTWTKMPYVFGMKPFPAKK